MTPDRLLAHFDRLAEAPHAIPRLRRFILGLAVRGKLVEQDPNDECASELLKRIQAEKERLAKEGKIRKQLPIAKIDDGEVPYQVPPAWCWVRFGDLVTNADAGWSPKSEGFPKSGDNWGVLKVSAVSWDKFLPEENKQLPAGVTPPEAARIHAGDFLISRANTSELVANSYLLSPHSPPASRRTTPHRRQGR